MKKIDVKFLLLQGVILIVVSIVAGMIAAIAYGSEDPFVVGFRLMPLFFFLVLMVYCAFANKILGTIAKKTMRKNVETEHFEQSSTFTSDGAFTIGTIVKIDEITGRIAYVSYWNPFEFQVIQAKEITNIKSSYKKGPFGGTNYVYFEFYYKNKRLRIPTFIANNMYSMKSQEVLEGISKADAFCDILTSAQKAGV